MQVQAFQLRQGSDPIPADPSWDGPRTLVLVFFAPEFALEPGPLLRLRSLFPQSHFLGTSTAASILGSRLEERLASVAILHFDATELVLAKEETTGSGPSLEAGKRLGRTLNHPDLKGVFVLSTGLGVNGAEAIQGLNQTLDAHVQSKTSPGRAGGFRM